MTNQNPKPFSGIQDKGAAQNPKERDKIADNCIYTENNAIGHLEEPSASRAADSIESVASSSPGGRGGMAGEV